MGHRPAHVKPPAYLTPTKPVPVPDSGTPEAKGSIKKDPLGLNPTRYGDWELKGIAIDF